MVFRAAAVRHHVHNVQARDIVEELIRVKHSGYLSTHSLTEVYSVMTRTPFKPWIAPGEALRLIEDQILTHMTLVSLDETEYVDIIRSAAHEGWVDGRIHDAIHLRCAAKMKCDRVYTFNVRDFRAVAPESLADRIAAPKFRRSDHLAHNCVTLTHP
jgi:predicted nucleic acid-binding protein